MGFITSRIQNKLIVSFVLVLLIPLVAVGLYAANSANSALQSAALEAETRYVEALSSDMETFLSGAVEDVLFLSQSAPLMKLVEARFEGDKLTILEARTALENEFLAFSQAKGIYDQVKYLDETGIEFSRVDFDGTTARRYPQGDLRNKAESYYFQNTMRLEEGQVFVSLLDLAVEWGRIEFPYQPVIRYGTPVFYKGQPAGIVITYVLADKFLDPLQEVMGRTVFLVDRDGFYLSHSDEDKEWGRDLETGITLAQDYPEQANKILSGGSGTLVSGGQLMACVKVVPAGQTEDYWVLVGLRPLSKVPPQQGAVASARLLASLFHLDPGCSAADPRCCYHHRPHHHPASGASK
jgi:methyl-accepting chemotaxis protein